MAVAVRGSRGSIGGGFIGVYNPLRSFSYRIFVSAMFTLLFVATLSVILTNNPSTPSLQSSLPSNGNADVHRTFLIIKSDPLKTRLDLIYKQASDHMTLVNAYAAYARKIKLGTSKQLRLLDDLAKNLNDITAKPIYKAALFEGAVDEDVLKQFEKEVKERVKVARQMIAESKENYDNQIKIQKLKDTIFSVNELLVKAKRNGVVASLISAKLIPKSLHCLAMRLVEERISHPEKYMEEEKWKAEFENPSLYH